MSGFICVPANKLSLSARKLVFGVGINDADYMVRYSGQKCPYYTAWSSMLERCYSSKLHARHQSYVGCSVVEEWHIFTAFKVWMEGQNWKGKQLDKDLLAQGNKVYSPDTCLFVAAEINTLLTDRAAGRGSYPVGVSLHRPTGRFISQCNAGGSRNHLGYFDTPEEASIAYLEFKRGVIRNIAINQEEPLRSALMRWKL